MTVPCCALSSAEIVCTAERLDRSRDGKALGFETVVIVSTAVSCGSEPRLAPRSPAGVKRGRVPMTLRRVADGEAGPTMCLRNGYELEMKIL